MKATPFLSKEISKNIEVTCNYFLKDEDQMGKKTIYVKVKLIGANMVQDAPLISTGIKARPNEWNGSRVIGKAHDVTIIQNNKRLQQIENTLERQFNRLQLANITNLAMAEYEIMEYIKPEVTKRTTKKKKEEYLSKLASHKLTALADSYLTGRLNKKGKPISEGYKQKFYDVISHYTKFNHGIEPVITEITKENVSRFKMYLQKRMKHNGYTTYLNKLRTIFCYAVDNDLIVKSPIPRRGLIEGYKKVEMDILNENEVRKIFQIPDNCLTPSQAKAKYCFLFMVLTGIGYGEMRSIRKEHLKNLDDDLYIQKEREKTPVVYRLPLSSFALEILEKIKNKNENDESLFNKLYSIELMLRRLKEIAELSSISKNLTTYLGRHTFGTDMANNGHSMFGLQNFMGHSDIRTTQQYLHSTELRELIIDAKETYKGSKLHNIHVLN